jgi:hypothetical protein
MSTCNFESAVHTCKDDLFERRGDGPSVLLNHTRAALTKKGKWRLKGIN